MKGNTTYPWRALLSGHMATPWRTAAFGIKLLLLLLLPLAARLIMLVGMGVGKKELPGALLDFPPPAPLTDTGPFPLVLKFHKVPKKECANASLQREPRSPHPVFTLDNGCLMRVWCGSLRAAMR
jgi:hypothetical protein